MTPALLSFIMTEIPRGPGGSAPGLISRTGPHQLEGHT